MKKYLYIAACVAAVCLSSCSKEQQIDEPEGITCELRIEAYTISTKGLDLDGTTLNAVWNESDEVTVFFNNVSIGTLKPEITGSSHTWLKGTIKTTNVRKDNELRLLMPREEWLYTGQDGSLDGVSNYAYAATKVKVLSKKGSTITTEPAEFVNQQAIVRFRLFTGDDTPIAADGMTISTASGKLVTGFGTAGIGVTYGTLDIIAAEPTQEFYVALRSTFSSNDTYTITATSENKVYTCTKSGVFFENGRFYSGHIRMTQVEGNDIILKDFTEDGDSFPFNCTESEGSTTWVDMSSELLERELHMKYQDFAEHYTWLSGDNPVPESYRMEARIPVSSDLGTSTWSETAGDNLYGTVTYRKDTGVGGVNDKFFINVNYWQKTTILTSAEGKKLWPNGVVTLYAKFQKDAGYVPEGMPDGFTLPDIVYIGLTFKVDPIGFDTNFILHNPSYWFDDLDEGINTVRRNVNVPLHWLTADISEEGVNDDVTDLHTLLTQDWAANSIFLINKEINTAEILADPGNPLIPEDAIDLFNNDEGYYCRFSFVPGRDQPTINGQKWEVKPGVGDTTTLWWGKNGGEAGKYTEKDVVVKLNTVNGDLRYVWQQDSLYVSKYLLNLWEPYAEPYDQILYCKVRVSAYQSGPEDWLGRTCDIEVCHEDFNVRFLRPMNFNLQGDGYLVDGQPGGSYIPLGGMFEAFDWNRDEFETGFRIFDKYITKSQDPATPDKDSTYFDTCYYTDRGVDIHQKDGAIVEWYGYYGFSSMAIDIDGIRTDQHGEGRRDLVKILTDPVQFNPVTGEPVYDPGSANPTARFWVADAADKRTPVNPESVDISKVGNLSKYIFVYANDNGVTKDFHFYIPVKVVYAWGVYEAVLEVPVRGTKYHPTPDDNILD